MCDLDLIELESWNPQRPAYLSTADIHDPARPAAHFLWGNPAAHLLWNAAPETVWPDGVPEADVRGRGLFCMTRHEAGHRGCYVYLRYMDPKYGLPVLEYERAIDSDDAADEWVRVYYGFLDAVHPFEGVPLPRLPRAPGAAVAHSRTGVGGVTDRIRQAVGKASRRLFGGDDG